MVVASPSRRRSLARRRLCLCAGVAGVVGLVFVVLKITSGPPVEQQRASRYVTAWSRGDYAAMYAELTDAAKRAWSLQAFSDAERRAAATATAVTFVHGRVPKVNDHVVDVPMMIRTRAFGTLRATLALPFSGDGDAARIDWTTNLSFPGVAPGEQLQRTTELPVRADILARDGTPLAQGAARTSPLGPVATAIAGTLAAPPPDRVEQMRELGIPAGGKVGISGLERVFDAQLTGRPGGTLRAGSRVLASTLPKPARAVRTTIDPAIQRATVEALGSQFGGIAVLRPRTGEILGLAGVAFSGLQPPGSTFKIVTLAGALQARIAGPNSTYPYETSTQIEGVDLQNANGESCGGSLRLAFAVSCNSVFAPLGARLGATRLVQTAEALGFNQDLHIPGAATSTIPQPDEIGDALAVGSSAIGQGRVQATALQMGWVAATIAQGGVRTPLTLQTGGVPTHTRVLRASTARMVGSFMESVVQIGTGRAAAIPGIRVAGKTGTAELKDTTTPECKPTDEQPDCPPVKPDDPTDTDAWFAAYAPANKPRIAVGVVSIANGAGGDTAAPLAREVLLAGLKATG